MKFSLSPKELNNWKGLITERLAECYIEHFVNPKLKENEGWDSVIFDNLDKIKCPINAIEKALLKGNRKPIEEMAPYMQSYYRDRVKWIKSDFKKILMKKGFFPNEDLFEKYMNLMEILEVSTDGFLFKLKRTGDMKPMEEIISDSGECVYPIGTTEVPKMIPIVDGQIEIVEIKSGKAFIPPYQQANYRKVVENGYFFRFFHVDIVSFERNHFEIEEKLVKNPLELRSFRA